VTQNLKREVFTTSRELEYFTEAELTTQTGYDRSAWWPFVIVKETLDNALDACEQAGIAPEITLAVSPREISITDNGCGISPKTVRKICDYSTRTSDKRVYISPTRGLQGNGWKTLLPIAYMLNPSAPAITVIEACGVRHEIRVSLDQVARQPRIEHTRTRIVKKPGTSIVFTRQEASFEAGGKNTGFLQKLLFEYSLFNPHLTLKLLNRDGKVTTWQAANRDWKKWWPTDPTSAYWYSLEQFEELIASYVAAERDGGRVHTVREFITEFRGLQGTAKQKQVTVQAGLERSYLHDLVQDGAFDQRALKRLLDAIKLASSPVRPQLLGILGKDYLEQKLYPKGTADHSFRYHRVIGTADGLPYVVEAAFRRIPSGLHVGLNWSAPLDDPLDTCYLELESSTVRGLDALFATKRISCAEDSITVVLHIAYPRFQFFDRGKGSVNLPQELAQAVSRAVLVVTKEWAAIKRKREREQHTAARQAEEQLREGRQRDRITIEQAASRVMAKAYRTAALGPDGSLLPVKARQIMYAARGAILELTGLSEFNDNNFTQKLLPAYIREHPEECASWDVIYDARGHLTEPFTGYSMGIGTMEVRVYLKEIAAYDAMNGKLDVPVPEISMQYHTRGPRNRYGALLFVEKEGFNELFKRVRLDESYDMANTSSKGMGSTSVRQLFEQLALLYSDLKILVLHDFDKSGFSIAGTLQRSTERFQFKHPPEIINLGLRLEDVESYGLASEPVDYKSDPGPNLSRNGATAAEIQFLRGEPYTYMDKGKRKQGFHGQRVELNAFTNSQMLEWLEGKLMEHGVEKVIPDDATLARDYRRKVGLREYQRLIEEAKPKAEEKERNAKVPKNLRQRIKRRLKENPSLAWDDEKVLM
jgi:DNA topoisomerase VI subunit B